MALERRHPAKGLGPPSPLFTSSISVSPGMQTLYISGQTGTKTADGAAIVDPDEQAAAVYSAIEATLVAAGMGWQDVVNRTTWITEDCPFATYSDSSIAAFGDTKPTSSGLGIPALSDGCYIEIEITACKALPSRSVLKFSPPGTPDPTPPGLWPCVTAPAGSRLLFCSGQTDAAPDHATQAANIYSNLSTILADAGMGWEDCVKRRTFRTPSWDRTADIEAGRAAMAGEMSCHTGVGVRCLAADEFLAETELYAAQPLAAGTAPATALKKWNPAGIAEIPGIVHAVEVPPTATMLYTRGCVGKRADGTIPETAAEQSEAAFACITTILEDAGMGALLRLPSHIARLPVGLPERTSACELTSSPSLALPCLALCVGVRECRMGRRRENDGLHHPWLRGCRRPCCTHRSTGRESLRLNAPWGASLGDTRAACRS
jgi:enamine deaminase RidA (YjgF/YER057c/UK114 family)